MQTCPDELIAFAAHLADIAGEVVRPYFRQPLDVEAKADASPVTLADRNAEAAMRRVIEQRYPEHGIYGEEYGVVRPDAEWVWILDPIDGTKSFVTGLPIFGTLVALTFRGMPALGIIDQPIMRDRWIGAKGHRTTFNGAPAPAGQRQKLAEAAIVTTYLDGFNDSEAAAFTRLRKACRINRLSGDCIAYALIAGGFVDLVVDGTIQPYDYAALIPVIEGAGGSITDWEGRVLDTRSPARVLASANAGLHAQALEYLRGA